MYDSKEIANCFIHFSTKNGNAVSAMKLQKLVYYAHGWFLGITDEALISEEIQAWQYGPVIPSLYQEFKKYGSTRIENYAKIGFDDSGCKPDNPTLLAFIEKIWSVYGKLSATQLSKMTHESGSPWAQVWGKNGVPMNTPIPNPLIRDYFKNQL